MRFAVARTQALVALESWAELVRFVEGLPATEATAEQRQALELARLTALRRGGDLARASECADRALRELPPSKELLCECAQLRHELGEWRAAIGLWERLRREYPETETPAARLCLIQAHLALHDRTAAGELLSEHIGHLLQEQLRDERLDLSTAVQFLALQRPRSNGSSQALQLWEPGLSGASHEASVPAVRARANSNSGSVAWASS